MIRYEVAPRSHRNDFSLGISIVFQWPVRESDLTACQEVVATYPIMRKNGRIIIYTCITHYLAES